MMAAWVKFFAGFERDIVSCMSLSFSCRTENDTKKRERERYNELVRMVKHIEWYHVHLFFSP